MSVREVIFPVCVAGVSGGPGFLTNIHVSAAGFEFRNVEWSRQRCEYDVTPGIKAVQDGPDPVQAADMAREIRNLFYSSYGRAYGFLFYDWNDHSIGTEAVPQSIGNGMTFQIYKRYQFGSFYYDRRITRPAPKGSGEIIWFEGSQLSSTDYDIDTTTGELTLYVTGAGDCSIYLPTFYVPVRFDSDQLPQELLLGRELMDTSPIKLVEIKEEGVEGET